MFSLIITVSSIALVVALVAATMYFGGDDTLTKGRDEATAAQAVNELNQIRSAQVSYKAMTGDWPVSLTELTEEQYLAAAPQGWVLDALPSGAPGISVASRALAVGDDAREEAICHDVNLKLGMNSTPLCSEITGAFVGCCISGE